MYIPTDIDFTTHLAGTFRSRADYLSNHFQQFKTINDLASSEENIEQKILALVLFFYLRIDACHERLGLEVPEHLSASSLRYSYGANLFIDVFSKTEAICRQNSRLAGALAVLKPYYIKAAEGCNDQIQEYAYDEITSLAWSDDVFLVPFRELGQFGKPLDQDPVVFSSADQVVWLYLQDEFSDDFLAWSSTLDEEEEKLTFNYGQIDFYLPPSPEYRIVCDSDRYLYYLGNLLEKSGWPVGETAARLFHRLNNVYGVATNRVRWAVATLQLVLSGYEEALDGELRLEASLRDINGNDVDVVMLPELLSGIEDCGTIHLGARDIEYSNPLYSIAYLYSRLNSCGRMHLAIPSYLNKRETQVIAHFVDQDELEAVIQYEDRSSYLIVNKKKPAHKTGKIMLFYSSTGYIHNLDRFKKCFESFVWDLKSTRHEEAAFIASTATIKRREYLIRPKEYVFDFSALIGAAEFEVVSHLTHNISPRIGAINSVITHVEDFLVTRGLAGELLQEVFFEGQPEESVADALAKAQADIMHVSRLMKDTRAIVAQDIDPDDFEDVDIGEFLNAAIAARYSNRFYEVRLDHSTIPAGLKVRLHRITFLEMMDNIIRNAEIHGFVACDQGYTVEVVVAQDEKTKDVVIEICNNGEPFAEDLTEANYLSFGHKRKGSPGDGHGGAFVDKVIRQHRWDFAFIRDRADCNAGVRITISKGGQV